MKSVNQNENRAGVWMDHHLAHIVSRDEAGNYSINTIETDHFKAGSAGKKKHTTVKHVSATKKQEELKKFYKKVQTQLSGCDHVLICGPTTAKSEFHHVLKKARSFHGKRIAEMNAPVMTDRQLISFMKKNLGKPMDIYREEEVL